VRFRLMHVLAVSFWGLIVGCGAFWLLSMVAGLGALPALGLSWALATLFILEAA
jgi:hypothetical protein